jgi:hypothetical protein
MKCCLPIIKIRVNPDDGFGEALPFTILGHNSPLSYRKAARYLAEDFANYTGFSPAPYDTNELKLNQPYWHDRVLLFVEQIGSEKIRCFGAVGIRWKKYDDIPEGWFMTWAWFHPSEQRKGHLKNAWPHIAKLFPNFVPDPPFSPAMKAFLRKIQFSHLHIPPKYLLD